MNRTYITKFDTILTGETVIFLGGYSTFNYDIKLPTNKLIQPQMIQANCGISSAGKLVSYSQIDWNAELYTKNEISNYQSQLEVSAQSGGVTTVNKRAGIILGRNAHQYFIDVDQFNVNEYNLLFSLSHNQLANTNLINGDTFNLIFTMELTYLINE